MSSTDLSGNVSQILSDIQTLQSMEQDLFNILATTPNLSDAQVADLTKKINQLSTMRMNLYKLVNTLNLTVANELDSSQIAIGNQEMAVKIVEDELNKMKQNLSELTDIQNNKIRLISINTYYGDRYAEHSDLMKILIYMLVPIIILSILFSKGIIPAMIYYILLGLISAIGGYFLIYRFATLVFRDNMEFNKYNFGFDAGAAPKPSGSADDPWAVLNPPDLSTCVGQMCCSSNQRYDNNLNRCINN